MNNFYRAFEEKYRGSRDLIKNRLQVYVPLIRKINIEKIGNSALDLGCGRGEWLEILRENGFFETGIDINEEMIQICQQQNLKVKNFDVLSYLKDLPDESISIVSGFHIVEHLSFEILQTLVQEALRVLKPSGLLILETPNPENISVGSNSFYLDPTHQRPIPPDLLSFLPEYYGFFRHTILRLQEDPALSHQQYLTLSQVLSGVSPDYAVVAQKKGPSELTQEMNFFFDAKYGVTLDMLATRYQQGIENAFRQLMARLAKTEALAQQFNLKASHVENLVEEIEAKLAQIQALVQQNQLNDQSKS